MALLQGNNLSEWIKALEPVTDWSKVEKGDLIIHLESQTMQPLPFHSLSGWSAPMDDEVRDFAQVWTGDDPHHLVLFHGLDGWFYFPAPAPELQIIAKSRGKVVELGDGKWSNHGFKER